VGVALAALAAPPAYAAKRPNLVPSPPKSNATSATAGHQLVVSYRLVSRGGRAPASLTGLFLSRDGKRNRGDAKLGQDGVPAGRSVRAAIPVVVPPRVKPRRYRLIACADYRRKVRESREGDNCRASRKRVAVMPAHTAAELIESDRRAGRIDAETALRYRIFATFGDDRLPGRYARNVIPMDDDHAVDVLAREFANLSPATQEVLRPFLIPPFYAESWANQGAVGSAQTGTENPAGCNVAGRWEFVEDGPLKVWYLAARAAEDRALAERLAALAQTKIDPKLQAVWERDVLGHGDGGTTDPEDNCRGRDGKLDISLVRGLGSAGVAVTRCDDNFSSYVLVKRDSTDEQIQSTLAHELFHVGQAYNGSNPCGTPLWLSESTASWFQDFVYERENQSEHWKADHFLYNIDQPLFDEEPVERAYGAYLFWLYLTRTGTPPTVVKQTFDYLPTSPDVSDAVDAAIGGYGEHWSTFALYALNQDPVPQLDDWDDIKFQPYLQTATTAMPEFTFRIIEDMPGLSARYYWLDLGRTKARRVEVANVPGSPITVQAIPRTAAGWLDPVKLSGEKAWCRDKREENLTDLMLVVSHDQPGAPLSLNQLGLQVRLEKECAEALAKGQLVFTHTGQRDQGTADDTQYEERIVVDAAFRRSKAGEWFDAGTTATFSGGDQGVRPGGGCEQPFTATYSGSAPPFSQLSLDVFGDEVAVFFAAFEGRRDETFSSTGAGCGEPGTSSSSWGARVTCGEGVVTRDAEGKRTITFDYESSFSRPDGDGATETCKGTIVEEGAAGG
jgi:hypothetical protein